MSNKSDKQQSKKRRKSERKARKEAEKAAEAAAAAELARVQAKRRKIMMAIPVLTALVALGAWLVLEDKRLAGVSILVGGLLFLLISLGALGSSVTSRDRLKSGSIDFGSGNDGSKS